MSTLASESAALRADPADNTVEPSRLEARLPPLLSVIAGMVDRDSWGGFGKQESELDECNKANAMFMEGFRDRNELKAIMALAVDAAQPESGDESSTETKLSF
jgi:hypothetical protein